MLFLFLLAGSALVGAFVLAYAAHCVVVVVEGTAAGHDRVVWPDEPLADWVLGAVRLLGRLAWLIHLLKPLPARPAKRTPAAKVSKKPARRPPRKRPAPSEDPWTVSEDEAGPELPSEPPPAQRPKGVIPRSPDEVE